MPQRVGRRRSAPPPASDCGQERLDNNIVSTIIPNFSPPMSSLVSPV